MPRQCSNNTREKNAYLLLVIISFFSAAVKAQTLPQLDKNSIQDVVAEMTLGEKAKFVFNNELIAKKAAASDIAAITIGRNTGEGKGRQVNDDFNLSDTGITIIKNLAGAFNAQNKKVIIYEFGYGLSSCNFTFGNLKLSSSTLNNSIAATFTIINQGKMPGKQIAEIYISTPAKNLDKPGEELKAFAKTKLLKPGETQTLKFTFTAADLASFYTDKELWIADAGMYTIKAGASSAGIRLTAVFNVAKDIIVEKVNKVLVPQNQLNELKPSAKETGYIEELNNFGM